MSTPVLVGLVDSGVDADQVPGVVAGRTFNLGADGNVMCQPAGGDPLGHGTTLARIILSYSSDAHILNAQVFTRALATSPAVVAASLDWLVAEGAQIVNMSLGLRQDRQVLREACHRALAEGIVMVAASPARGDRVFPSAYDGVVKVTGDARCQRGEISHLGTLQADFGACPRSGSSAETERPAGGASFAVGHVTGLLASYLASGRKQGTVERYLREAARYHGPERRMVHRVGT